MRGDLESRSVGRAARPLPSDRAPRPPRPGVAKPVEGRPAPSGPGRPPRGRAGGWAGSPRGRPLPEAPRGDVESAPWVPRALRAGRHAPRPRRGPELSWRWHIGRSPAARRSAATFFPPRAPSGGSGGSGARAQASASGNRRAPRQAGGVGAPPGGRAQVSSSAFVWRSPLFPVSPISAEKPRRRDPLPRRPLGPVLENPWPRGGSPARTCPAPAAEPPVRRNPAGSPVPAPRSRARPPASVPAPRSWRPAPYSMPGGARPRGALDARGRDAAPRSCGRGTRSGLGCGLAESGLGPLGASYPRGCRRQAGPRGPGSGL